MEENEIAIESGEGASPAADGRLDANAQRIRTSGLVLLLAVVLTGAWALPQHWDVYGVIGFGLITLLVMATGFLAFTCGQFLVEEPLSELLHAIRGEGFSVRGRSRFISRLKHECKDAESRGRMRTFSLAVIAAPGSSAENRAEDFVQLRERVRGLIRSRDVVGEFATGEVWVLALGAGAGAAETLCGRLETGLATQIRAGGRAPMQIGWSTFETDATDAARLIRVARDRARLPDVDLEEAA